jgi:NADPH-dependent curcumin reductase CurA
MPEQKNRRITLASRPVGEPKDENFKLVEEAIPEPKDGQVLLRILYLSLDPYMRGRMSDAKSYAKPTAVGDVMEGGTVCEVVSSKFEGLKPGDFVLSYDGWQEFAVTSGKAVRKLEKSGLPLSTAVGVLGMPGLTAYKGLIGIGKPKAGETVVVAAASGAVGSVVGQIAKVKGCKAIGIAGGKKKCEHVVKEFGFDVCLDHKAPDFAKQLEAVCPNGIDVYFENVGGHVAQAVWPLLNDFARVPVCGLIAQYNAVDAPSGPVDSGKMMRDILSKRLLVQGFIVMDNNDLVQEFGRDMTTWVKDGSVKYLEDVVDGIENTVSAFQGLLRGDNFGKLVVKVAEPTAS